MVAGAFFITLSTVTEEVSEEGSFRNYLKTYFYIYSIKSALTLTLTLSQRERGLFG